MEQAMPVNDTPQTTQAIRLIFEYEGDQVRLISQQPVNMAVTGAELGQVAFPGYYVETRDTKGKTLSRTVAHNAFSSSTEVFPEQPGQPITRVNLPKAKGAFTVITPVPLHTDHVSVVQIAPGKNGQSTLSAQTTSPAENAATVRELASFKITLNK
jgi:hypothetical protein